MAPGLVSTEPASPYIRGTPGAGADTFERAGSDVVDRDFLEPIAVVGLSLKFPQDATSSEAFWKVLMEKRSAVTEIPADRLNVDAFHGVDKSRPDTITPRGGHFVKEDLSLFDAPFFSITATEAASMDIQQRQLLECVYRALENAGAPLEKVNGSKTSVHTGSFADDYRLMTMRDHEQLPKYAATGSSISILANRISWFYNLHGPSLQVDTACSSSLMAFDMACQGLRNGESNMALVAGSNTVFGMDTYQILSNMNFLSPDSRCYSFDHRANGYARGEGFGVLVLKRLTDAVRDGDSIRSVVRSTGSNSDGRTPGIAQPSKDAQERLIRETYRKAGLDAGLTRFVEAHGTGTAVGDPIEATALGDAFGEYRNPEEPLYVGAVKSNVGHLEGTSGVAGVIKAILALEKGVIPPNTNFERLNHRIDAPSLNLSFPTKAISWPTRGLRRASVNSFGFGGSNAHVVLDDAYNFLKIHGLSAFHNTATVPPHPEQLSSALGVSSPSATVNGEKPAETAERSRKNNQPALLVWSAADEEGIKRLSDAYDAYFRALALPSDHRARYLSDLAYTLSERRSVFPWKSFAVSRSVADLQNTGVSFSRAARSSRKLSLGFVFTGQGAQFAGMGRDLLIYPVFRNTLQRAQLYLYDLGCSWSLMDELLKAKDCSNVNRPDMSQPLCTALQIALIELLHSFRISPKAVVGHSSGEIAAAYCLGALSLRSACKVAYYRGKLAAQLSQSAEKKGTMMAVGIPESKAAQYIDKVALKFGSAGIVVACVNSPGSVTISGDEDQIDYLHKLLVDHSIFARKLQVDVGYHSPHMNQMAREYLLSLNQLELGRSLPGCAFMVSTVTKTPVGQKDLCRADYWVKNLTSPVRFSDALAQLVSSPANGRKKLGGGAGNRESVAVYDLLELGPHSALAGPTKETLKTVPHGKDISYASCLSRNVSALDSTMDAAGRLWCLGYPVDIGTVNQLETTKGRQSMCLTSLPEYPFDHSKSYWHESRVSKEYRLRRHPRLDLLGSQASGWNPLEARWRKFIRLSETLWVADHVVNGSTIYPAAGMLVMAIEGTRQLVDGERNVKGYRIKEATFSRALAIDAAEQGTESQLYIRPAQDAFGKDTGRFDFRICTGEDGGWAENCRGIVQVEYDRGVNDVDDRDEEASHSQAMADLLADRVTGCTRHVDASEVYSHFEKMGLGFGPSFQTLEDVACNDEGEVVAQVKAFLWEAVDNANPPQAHLIHPTTLDGLIQLVLVGLTRGARTMIPTTVPTRITNLWLSSSGISHPEITSLTATSRQLSKGARQTESSFAAFDQNGSLRASAAILETTNIDRQEVADSANSQRKLCYSMDWKPDIDLLSPSQGQAYLKAGNVADSVTADFYRDLGFFLYSTIQQTLPLLDPAKIDPSKSEYINWMKLQIERFNSGQLLHGRADWSTKLGDANYQAELARKLGNFSSEGKFYVEVSRHLLPILHGEVDALALLFQGDLAKEYYLEINSRLSAVFHNLVDLLAHKNPCLKALEIGAGTGGTTVNVIKPLFLHGNEEPGTPRCSQYDFTDISPSFFEKAEADFQAYRSRMKYKILDIESDPVEQGFRGGTYDLVLAANVLHATKNMDDTLKNVRSLLKPGGKLVLLEQTGDFARGGFAFGLLRGWWLTTDDYRSWGPTMTPEKWNRVLTENGFSGTDFVLHDYQDPKCQELSIIVSTALEPEPPQLPAPKIMLVTSKDSLLQDDVSSKLQQGIQARYGVTCEISHVEDDVAVPDSSECFCIFMVELDSPVLQSMDQMTFDKLRATLISAQGLIWITGGGGASWETPEYQVADGLLRALRTENAMLKAVTLALDPARAHSDASVEAVLEILATALSSEASELEAEYRDQGGLISINRVVEANSMNDHIHHAVQPQRSLTAPFGAPGLPPLSLHFKTPGLLDSLRFIEDEAATRPIEANEVEIEVKAVGVNFMDLLTALGRINQVEIGGECAGIVSRVGGDSDLQPGDRVCAIAFDSFKTYARSDHRTAVKIPDGLSFTEAAALPVTYTTAHYALIVAGRLQRGDKVLIHAAAGGTGQSAVQLAQNAGAEVFATVGSSNKRKLLMELYGIPSDHIFYSRDTNFAQGVMRVTQNQGVDVVLNSLAGEGLAATWECMASFGRFVEIGKRDIHSHSRLDMFHFAKNVSFTAVDIFGMTRERPALVRASLSAALDLVSSRRACASQPVQVYPVSQIESAFRHMQSGKSVGKLVIAMKEDERVLTELASKPSYSLNANATYVVAGGFGGIARLTARWMAARGARNLVLLSRSGPNTEAARVLLDELHGDGVHVHAPQCDVASDDSLGAVLKECSETMPPIKGCIQGAMVLRDAMFEKMTYDEWNKALVPKVNGTRNLDRLLPSGLDFFIMLSSVVGIHGSAGQANYAAAGTYQDSLARHRTNKGEKATSLDLGWMVSDGIIAESEFLTRAFETSGLMMPVDSAEYLALLDYYCNAGLPVAEAVNSQMMVGLETPAGLVAKGTEVPALLQRSTFRYLHAVGMGESAQSEGFGEQQTNWAAAFRGARSQAEARAIVVEGLTHKLSRALSMQASEIDTLRPLHAYGVDSLLAVELRSWMAKEFKSEVAVFEIMGAGDFGGVGTAVIAKSKREWEG